MNPSQFSVQSNKLTTETPSRNLLRLECKRESMKPTSSEAYRRPNGSAAWSSQGRKVMLSALLVQVLFVPCRTFAQLPGYLTLTMPPGYSMLASCFESIPDNRVQSIFAHFPGVFVPPGPYGQDADGVTIFRVESSGFRANNYLAGWSDPTMMLRPGEGWFFKNPYEQPLCAVIDGVGVDGTNSLPAGLSVCSSIFPQTGPLAATLGFPVQNGDTVFLWDTTQSNYSVFNFITNTWLPSEPVVELGRSFWVWKSNGVDWVQRYFGGNRLVVNDELVSQVGQLNFFTYNTDSTRGRALDIDLTPLSTNYAGQLHAGLNADEATFVPIGTPQDFQPGAGAGYLRSGVVSVPFALGGQVAYVQLRVWRQSDGATFETASSNRGPTGKSTIMALTCHAIIEAGKPGLPPPDANQFPSFHLVIPPPVLKSIGVSPGGALLDCAGTPGRTYWTQAATQLTVPVWQTISTNVGGVNGTFQCLDSSVTNGSSRYYRMADAQGISP